MEGGDTEERRKKVLGIECLFCTFFGESDIIAGDIEIISS